LAQARWGGASRKRLALARARLAAMQRNAVMLAYFICASALAETHRPHHALLRFHRGALLHRHGRARLHSVPHEEAVEAMGEKSIDDLQPEYVFDDDFVSDGTSKYKVLQKAHAEAEAHQHELKDAREVAETEEAELEAAESKAEALESVVEQKEAALTDAKLEVNATGTKDEEAELAKAEESLAEAEEAKEEAEKAVEEEAAKEEDAAATIAKLEEDSRGLRAEHAKRLQAAEEAREQFAPVAALEDRKANVDAELEKVEKIATKLNKEAANITEQLDSFGPSKDALDSAEAALEEVQKKITEVDDEIVAMKEKLAKAESAHVAAKEEVPDDVKAVEKAEGEVHVREQQLEHAKESFNEEDFKEAEAQEEAVDKELDEVKEKLDESQDKVEEKKDEAKEAAEKVEKADEVMDDSVKEVHEAQDAITTAPPTDAPPGDLEWNDPSTWVS